MLGILGCLYFGYHAFSGDRGLIRLIEVRKQLSSALLIAETTAKEKQMWQKEVKALSPSSLEMDTLETTAMEVLNMGNPQDFVITDVKD